MWRSATDAARALGISTRSLRERAVAGTVKRERGRYFIERGARSDVEHVMVCSDVHVPFHCPFAWAAFIKRLRYCEPDRLVINGDFADFAAVSSHGDAGGKVLKEEIDAVRRELSLLREIMGDKPIHYVQGNHEHRYTRFIGSDAPALEGMESWHSLLGLADFDITHTDYGDVHKIGHLGFTHGVFAGMHYAKQHLDRYGCNLVIGHCHRAQIFTLGVAGPEGSQHVRGAFGLPCMVPVDECDYIKGPTGWTQGHGEFWIERDGGRFTADVVIYTKQRFWRDGMCFDGRA
jgi:predicted phosphodiesterase